MHTLKSSEVRSNFIKIVTDTIRNKKVIKISSSEGNAVLLSEEDYESLLETSELLSIPGLKDSIKKADNEILKGDLHSFDEIFNEPS